jgi:hypothetical protein
VQGDDSSHASDVTVYMCCRDPEPGLKTAYGLCQQMIHFFHQLRLYITFEVIEPAWLHMNARMKAASTLDEVRALLLEPSEPGSAEPDHGPAVDKIFRQLAFDAHGRRCCILTALLCCTIHSAFVMSTTAAAHIFVK